MKVRSSLQFYGNQRGTLVMFNGTGTTDGADTEVFREIQLSDLTMQDTFEGGVARMTLIASGRSFDMLLSKVENQATWTNDQSGLDACYNTITAWKAEYLTTIATDSRLPDPGDEGDVLTVVDGEWTSAAAEGGGGLTEVTYDELVALISESGLTPGGLYGITDFATRHYFVDGNGSQSAEAPTTNTGTTETIIVRALDVNTLSTHALSVDYPQDLLEYDWNPMNWLADPSFGADGTIIDGWKGVITWRHDKILENYMQYDYRNVLFRRWTGGYVEYDTATVYSAGDRVLHSDGIIYGAIADITPEEVWTEAHWYKVWDTANGEYWMHTPTGNAGETFDDLPTFGGVAMGNKFEKFVNVSLGMYLLLNNTFLGFSYSNVFENGCNSNVFGNGCNGNVFGNICSSNVFGNICSSNVFGDAYSSNVFGDNCSSNVFGDNCSSNVFGNECYSNVFGDDCDSNVFGNSCYSNVFGNDCYSNVFGDNCSSNVFGDNCSSNVFGDDCGSNVFGDDCESNVFGNYCYSNVFGDDCESNVFGDDCESNVFGNGCEYIQLPPSSVKNDFKSGVAGEEGTPLNLTSSTLVTGNYPVTYTVASDGTIVAVYIDASNAQVITETL